MNTVLLNDFSLEEIFRTKMSPPSSCSPLGGGGGGNLLPYGGQKIFFKGGLKVYYDHCYLSL